MWYEWQTDSCLNMCRISCEINFKDMLKLNLLKNDIHFICSSYDLIHHGQLNPLSLSTYEVWTVSKPHVMYVYTWIIRQLLFFMYNLNPLLHQTHPSWHEYPNNIWWTVQIMKLLIIQLSQAFHNFLPLGSKYSPQHGVFKLLNLNRQSTYYMKENKIRPPVKMYT